MSTTGERRARIARWEDLPPTQVAAGLARRVLSGEEATVIEVRMDQGVVLSAHAHPHEQFSHVVSGSIRYRAGSELDQDFIVEAGGVFHVLGGIPHQAEALADSVVVELFAPAREDLRA